MGELSSLTETVDSLENKQTPKVGWVYESRYHKKNRSFVKIAYVHERAEHYTEVRCIGIDLGTGKFGRVTSSYVGRFMKGHNRGFNFYAMDEETAKARYAEETRAARLTEAVRGEYTELPKVVA